MVDRDPRLDDPLARAEVAAPSQSPRSSRGGANDVQARWHRPPRGGARRRRPCCGVFARASRSPASTPWSDVCNWCSLESQLPFGLYDASHISGAVVLRLGAHGESYPGIRKDDVHVTGRITLADGLGAFGNPTSDSARTMVTTTTTRALVVVFAPREVDARRLDRVLDLTATRMREFTGATRSG